MAAAKTFEEVIAKAMTGPIKSFDGRLKAEFKDWISHEIVKYHNAHRCKSLKLWDFQELVLHEFFLKLFPKND